MKLCTWNTHHGGVRTDGKLDTAGLGAWLVTFAAAGVGVFCLQEVEQQDGYGNDDKVSKWLTQLGPEWLGVSVNASGVVSGVGISNAILVKGPVLSPVTKLGLFDGRSALSVVVGDVQIVCTHLSSDHQASRVVETVQLLRWLPGASRVVVAGDFNATPAAVEIAPWPALGFSDAWTVASKVGTASGFKPNGATHNANRIDYVLARGPKVGSCEVPDTGSASGVYPSDHSPVIVELS